MAPSLDFLDQPGRPGMFGALLDESARAAEDFCRVVEAFEPAEFAAERPGDDADTLSPRTIAAHVCGAARRYADYIRKARGLPHVDAFELPLDLVAAPRDVRPLLADGLRYTESALTGLFDVQGEAGELVQFQVRWGPVYDPEMILEHGIVHLLRHRRQLERWRAPR